MKSKNKYPFLFRLFIMPIALLVQFVLLLVLMVFSERRYGIALIETGLNFCPDYFNDIKKEEVKNGKL